MKFSERLDRSDNIRAWREYKRTHAQERTAYRDLSQAEKEWLLKLDSQLAQIEERYHSILHHKSNALRLRVLADEDWLQDFNMSLLLTFYLREDDAEYEASDDNILYEIEHLFFDEPQAAGEYGIGIQHKHPVEPPESYTEEGYCYLFHQLAWHSGLDWRDMLRIGGMWVDIKIDEQSGFLPTAEFV